VNIGSGASDATDGAIAGTPAGAFSRFVTVIPVAPLMAGEMECGAPPVPKQNSSLGLSEEMTLGFTYTIPPLPGNRAVQDEVDDPVSRDVTVIPVAPLMAGEMECGAPPVPKQNSSLGLSKISTFTFAFTMPPLLGNNPA